jgi:hypothetical protein
LLILFLYEFQSPQLQHDVVEAYVKKSLVIIWQDFGSACVCVCVRAHAPSFFCRNGCGIRCASTTSREQELSFCKASDRIHNAFNEWYSTSLNLPSDEQEETQEEVVEVVSTNGILHTRNLFFSYWCFSFEAIFFQFALTSTGKSFWHELLLIMNLSYTPYILESHLGLSM